MKGSAKTFLTDRSGRLARQAGYAGRLKQAGMWEMQRTIKWADNGTCRQYRKEDRKDGMAVKTGQTDKNMVTAGQAF